MYLMIFEDGTKWVNKEFSQEDKAAVENGMLEVIDLSTEIPKEYWDGKWMEVMDKSRRFSSKA